jgi:predicted GIY-YIG superfamily endonuclease
MPKLPVDYSKTIIYKLVHNEDYDNTNIYIGSTTDFVKRKNQHKKSCNNEKDKSYNEKKYQYIRNNSGWDEWNMIEIQKYPCNDKREAEAREEYWRCHFNAQLNTRRAYITDVERKEQMKEWYEQNKDKILEQNKEQKKEYNKEHYEQNKGKRLEQMKQYREQNKDKLLELNKDYYEQNKDKILEKKSQQITCECGCILTKGCVGRHLKSPKHLLLTK